MSEADPGQTDAVEPEFAEVGRARDSFEAIVWRRHLYDIGIEEVRTKSTGGILRAILYLGRRPVSVSVPRADLERAQELLRTYRFI
jgi:hypothetical protein